MDTLLHRWLLRGAITSFLIFGATSVWGQNPPPNAGSTTSPTQADKDARQKEIQAARAQVQQDEQKLRDDLKQYGHGSSQVKADHQQLRQDQLKLRKLGGGRHNRRGGKRPHNPGQQPPQG